MTNKIFHTHFVHPHVFLFISAVAVLVWFKTTLAATSLGHELQAGGGNIKCIDKERESLLHFKAHIQEDPYGWLSTWTAEEGDANCCKWTGVTCNNRTGHVTKISLFDNELRGEISPSLHNLTYLNHLDLSANYFHGTIPRSIGSLTRLRYLYLAENYISGTIPSSIGSLTNLMHLDLSDNSLLNGTIPPELGNLTNLQYLSLQNLVGCTVENLDWLSHLSQLQELDMSGTSLAKANHWVNVISSLPRLSNLSLRGCELSQVMHPYSSSLYSFFSSSIASLDLRENNLNSSMYHWLFPLTSNKLDALDLSINMLDGIPKYLGNLCSLTSLSVKNNSIAVKFSDFMNNLSGCTSHSLVTLYASNNQITGSFSDGIQMFSSLAYLVLSDNQLNGTLSEKVWGLSQLRTLDISSNSLRGVVSENIGKSKLLDINLSNNLLQGVPFKAHMSNNSSVAKIDLRSCKLGPHFPIWVQALNELTHLDISNNRISDIVPVEFWNMWPSQLTYLNLSSNNITGIETDLESNFGPQYMRIDLSSNKFYGPILKVHSGLQMLDLSKNKFDGGISFLCQIVDGFLIYADLSNNLFTGQIPDCLWHFKDLAVLNLAHNNLFGSLPVSIDFPINLQALYLNNNNFSGELPLFIKNFTRLSFLHMGSNRFSGKLPFWIGEKLTHLYSLSLSSNNFFGTIPLQICRLVNLHFLDLSMNNLYGTIPSCVNNLTAMVQERFSDNPSKHSYFWISTQDGVPMIHPGDYVDHAMIKWQGIVREFSSSLGLVKSIDLSCNNLTGQIPCEITNLYQLLVLNLSNNALSGDIPQKIGEMKELLTLDLSRNNISGSLPSSMSQMASLNYLDVSYNSLSGRIPSGTQLQSFEPSSYIGNARLCGLPLSKYCPGDKDIEVTGEKEDDGEGNDELERWFYIGGATGFPIGFWIVCSALLLNHRGKHAFFRFMDSMENWVYVKVVLFIAKLQRLAHL